MKTKYNRNKRIKTARLKAPSARAKATRLPRRNRISPPARTPAKIKPAKKVLAVVSAAPTERGLPMADNLQLYLREIGQVNLLTPQEEITLAKRVRKGDRHAREHMIKANLRLVVKIARDYEGLGLPLLDLVNEGNIGLMKGVERFDPRKGAKLSTYASWWIKQAIKRALANQSKTIRLPVHVVDKMAHIRRAEVKLREAMDREPTDEEVAADLGLSSRRVREYREASRAPISLDAPLGDDEPSPVSDVVADTSAAAPFDRLVKESDTQMVREVLGTLAPREREILMLRFGLDDDTPHTLEEIGAEFHLTRERIRQIQEEALAKLRTRMEKRDRLALEGATALAE
jgi:RNA polymerase primary sigma factor